MAAGIVVVDALPGGALSLLIVQARNHHQEPVQHRRLVT
jgi:hypothetical protein